MSKDWVGNSRVTVTMGVHNFTDEALEALTSALEVAISEINTTMFHLSLWICNLWDEYKFYVLMDYQIENDIGDDDDDD